MRGVLVSPRAGRIFIQVDVNMPDHPKVEGLSDAAFRALMKAWCYCRKYETDGFIKTASWTSRSTPKARRELVEAGLAHEVDGGVTMHDFTEHQQSKAEIQAHREKQASNGSKGGRPPKSRTQTKPTGFPLDNPNGTQTKAEIEIEKEKYKTSSSEAQAPPTPRPEVEHLCTVLADLIEANGSKRPAVTKAWLDSARLMLDRDGRDPAKAAELIRWVQGDEFWRSNVMSMPKFRTKYDELRLKATADWEAKRNGNVRPLRVSPALDAASRALNPQLYAEGSRP
jgi:hypothetical protein